MNSIVYSQLFLLVLEYLSFIAALWTFKYHNAVFRLLFFDLLFICILESTGAYLNAFHPDSKFLFSIPSLFLVAEIPIIYLISLKVITNHLFQKLASVAIAIFLALWIKDAITTKLIVFPTFLMFYASIFALIIFLAVLITMIGQDNIFKQPLFYFCLGMLIFYGCTIPYFGVINYFATKDRNILIKLVQILFVSNYIRYSLFAISYIVLYNQQKKKILQSEIATSV